MKIDRSRLKKSTSEVPAECQALIDKLRSCSHKELLEELKVVDAWTFGKCELYHWIDILDIFDSILEEGARQISPNNWILNCDLKENEQVKVLLLWILRFTTLLIEHSFSRHLYNSVEHLIALLASCDMNVVLAVLNLLYMFSKRSNFLQRIYNEKRVALVQRLTYLAENWGARHGYSLSNCVANKSMNEYPPETTTLHYEYYAEVPETTQAVLGKNKTYTSSPVVIHIEKLHTLNKTPAEIMNDIVLRYPPPRDKQVLMMLFTYIRAAVNFPNYPIRLLCVQARLQALSVLAYSNALAECAHTLLYDGLVEELRNVLHIAVDDQVEIRASAVRTLTSIIHLDRNPHFPKKSGSRLSMIIDVTGAASYHGFLPTLTRSCIYDLIRGDSKFEYFPPYEFRVEKYSLPLATSLFSFLYHLASYEAGGEALVSCGMMDSLLQVIDWPGHELEHITFVTRAVRVIDLITSIEMQGFQTRGGLASFINRLEMEVNICRKEQPFEIPTAETSPPDEEMRPSEDERPPVLEEMDIELVISKESILLNPPLLPEDYPFHSDTNADPSILRRQKEYDAAKTGKMCLPQRAALLKSMLNFLKKAIQDTSFADSIRHIMDGSLPSSLRHIISNAEYYGPSLFLLATDVVTVYVFQEPSLLSSLQDNGLTHVVLEALLVKDVPATREVLASLPNVFSALCLNDRGLSQFIVCNPFESLFKVLLSPVYLGAMRRRRTTDPIGDTASNLGNAMDELMRHQPTLKSSATYAIIKLLEELSELGRDPKFVCWRAQNRMDVSPAPAPRPSTSNEGGSSDEEEEDEEEASTSSHTQREETTTESTSHSERQPVALLDYIINVMKFVDAILSNNSTDDHCREFVTQIGLPPLMSILGLPNLPVDYPVTAAAQAVATVCKSILNLSHEPQVLKIGLLQLNVVLDNLRPLRCPIEEPGSSVLLHELATAPNLETAFSTASATPLLHAMSAAHGYVVMFVHVCRTGQTEIRSLSISHWASELGLSVLCGLARLYSALVWESTLLLALCSDDIIPADSKFGKDDLEKLLPPELRGEDGLWRNISNESNSNNSGDGTSVEAMNTDDDIQVIVEECGYKSKDGSRQLPTALQLKYIKPLLGASSRLGRALAELFGLLVKVCVGSPMRQRRGQQLATSTPLVPSPPARAVAGALTDLLVDGLNWKLLPSTPITKFKFTFLICSVGFTSPMLGDEKKFAYHLMLQKFGSLGFTAFLETFYWAISGGHKFDAYNGLEHPDLPEGTGEFLDAWLLLLEKLVNPKNVLESPHTISVKHGIVYKPFDAVSYLHKIHQRAFMAVGHLWGKKPLKHYGPRMSDTMMAIFKHILRGEKIWLEHCRKNKEHSTQPGESGSGTSSAPSSAGEPAASGAGTSRRPVDLDAPEPEVNQEALNQLMDMGFSRDHCVEALFHTSSVEQATEYLLTYPLSHNRPTHHSSMDVDLTEEDQMSRAISLSLGEKISDSDSKETQKPSTEPGMELDESLLIDKFTEHVLKDCLKLMDEIPDTVFRTCELLVAVAKRNGKAWCFEMLSDLTFEIATRIYYMIGIMDSPRVKPSEVVTELVESDAAVKASVRIHLFTLLFEGPQEMRLACIEVVEQTCINEGCCQLLMKAQKVLAAHGEPVTPKWMAPLILLIDLFEKVAVITHRKNEMLKVTNNVWRWFDLTSGKWTAYSVSNNKIINEGYWNGESAVRLNCGRRRYVIHFNYMIQTNEESGSRRPVTMSLTCREKTEGKDFPPRSEKKDDKESDKMETDQKEDEQRKKFKKMKSVCKDVQEALVRACVGILALPANTDTLHAAMRLCLRLSRQYENARTFAKLGGVEYLLNLTKLSSFGGFQELATMLIRHAIEEPVTLRHAMEKVIRSRTLPNIPPPYKEILYLMRNTSSCVCRDPNAYLEVACDILRCDLNLLPKRSEEDDPRLLVKAQPSRWNTALVMQEEAAVQVISDLLNALTRVVVPSEKGDDPESDKEKPPTKKNVFCSYNVLPVHNTLMHRYPGDPLLPDAIEDREQVRMFHQNNEVTNSQKKNRDDEGENSTQTSQRSETEKSGPLMSKSSILKILADAVRSYSACAKLIIDHTYSAGISDLVSEDCTSLAFILDKLIPANENQYDRDCQSTARMLISAIASCNHTPEAQTTLVCELKAALLRSLAMSESVEKHTRIANLSAIILHTIENCPPLVNQPQTPSVKLHQYSNNVNNIVKVMLRKGLLTDLARIAHYMDLSSPHVVNSINAVMKPLETLSRIVNQPSTSPPSKTGKAKSQIHPNGSTDHTGTTTSEATHAQGDDAVEDAENTDHDISGTAESLEPTSESHVQEDAVDDVVLDDVMDQLLERDGVGSNEENILNATFTVEPESQSNRMETDDVHTPPIRNQTSLQYGNDDDDTQDVDRVQSSDSDSGSNPSDDAEEEVNNVDDDDDDDDEEEDDEGDDNEDEEGGSGYDEDGLEFFESDEGLFRIPVLDRENEDILMIQYSDPDLSGPGPHVPWNSNSFPIPLGLFDDPANGNEATTVNRLTPNHPLLTARHPTDSSNITGPRTQRGNRPRRYQYLQLNGRSPNPPVILQRLLGPGNHDLSITTNQTGYRDATRVVVMDNGMGLFANTNSEEEQIDLVDQSGYLFGPSLTATLSNIPTALWWWCEEGKLLDGDSQPDCVVANASKVIEVLETAKSEEIALRRERFRKRMEEEETKKRKEDKKLSTDGDTEVASTSSGQPARRSSIATGNSDVTSATESLAESIVESVLRPTLQSQPPSVDGPDFSELTTGLLSSLSEILPSVTTPQNPLPRYSRSGFPVNEYSYSHPDDVFVYDSSPESSESSQRHLSRGNSLMTFHQAPDASNPVERCVGASASACDPPVITITDSPEITDARPPVITITNSSSENTGTPPVITICNTPPRNPNTPPVITITNSPQVSTSYNAPPVITITSTPLNSPRSPEFTIPDDTASVIAISDDSPAVITISDDDDCDGDSSDGESCSSSRDGGGGGGGSGSANVCGGGCGCGSRGGNGVRNGACTSDSVSCSDRSLFRHHNQSAAPIDIMTMNTVEHDSRIPLNDSGTSEEFSQSDHSHNPVFLSSSDNSILQAPEEYNCLEELYDDSHPPPLIPLEDLVDDHPPPLIPLDEVQIIRHVRHQSVSTRDRSVATSVITHSRCIQEAPAIGNTSSNHVDDDVEDDRYLREHLFNLIRNQSESPNVDYQDGIFSNENNAGGANDTSETGVVTPEIDPLCPIPRATREYILRRMHLCPGDAASILMEELMRFQQNSTLVESMAESSRNLVVGETGHHQRMDMSSSDSSSVFMDQSNVNAAGIASLNSSDAAVSDTWQSSHHDHEDNINNSPQITEEIVNLSSTDQSFQSDVAVDDEESAAGTGGESSITVASASPSASASASSSAADGDTELPEGVDPSFLAALPDEVREEVIAEQLRLQRLRQRAVQQSNDAASTNVTEVNPEFLAALPPAIQEEVLAQQRMEQQRQAAASANPNDPVDAAAFFQNLQPSLRQAILTDMEDSQISVLPPDLAQEAQNLRREWEARNRQLMQERFFSHVSHNNSALSSILRNTARVGSARYAIHTVPQRAQWSPWNSRPDPHPAMPLASHGLRLRGRQLLDHEALACLLVLLFLDEPKLNTARLHRVLRNLCYHGPTREWVIKALLSILDLCTEPKRDGRRKPQYNFFTTPLWLNVKMDTALGLRARVFNIGHQAGKRGNRSSETTGITVHKRAAPVIIRHTLEVLISLAKTFPGYFLPLKNKSTDKDANREYGSKSRASTSAGPSGSRSSRSDLTSFWDILLKLDSTTYSKKGKSVARSHCLPGLVCDDEHHNHSFESSPFGQLMKMLQKFPGYGPTLVDKMLRLLSLISLGLPEINPYLRHREHVDGKKEERDESVPVSKEYVRKIMTQLELQTCSEEGLEDATALLLNLSNCPDPTKEIIYGVLINGAINTANFVSQLLRGVQMELDEVNSKLDQDVLDDDDDDDDDGLNEQFHEISDSDEEYETSESHDLSEGNEIEKEDFESDQQYNSYEEDSEGLQGENYETVHDYEVEGEEMNYNENENCADNDYDYVEVNEDAEDYGDIDSFGDEVDVFCDENGENDYSRNNDVKNRSGNVDSESIENVNDGEDQDTTLGEYSKGVVPDRFTNGTVVVSAPAKVKGCYDVFMPSLNSLTKRTSTQAFFLRMLKVIVQIRESVRMSRRRRQENVESTTSATTTNATATRTTMSTTTAAAAAAAAAATTNTPAVALSETNSSKTKEEERVLPPLSQELEQIDHLWDTLSSVLTKLAETPDNHHAVMSLQPTVEAFFLVHSTTGEEQRSVYEGRLDPSLSTGHGTFPEGRPPNYMPEDTHHGDSDDLDPNDPDDFDPDETLNQASPSYSPVNSPANIVLNEEYTSSPDTCSSQNSSSNTSNSTVLSSTPTFSYSAPLGVFPVSPLQPDSDGSAVANAQQSPVFQSSSWEQTSPPVSLNPDQQKFLKFAEKHRAVLNQILRQSTTHLADGPFAVLVDHTRVLDFDVKRKYFRSELERMDEGIRREELAVHVRRSHVFEDSFRELHRRTIDEWKNRFYIVFEGEEGQDAGGLLREWYVIISREIFNPMYALFTTSPGDRVTYMINPSSHCNPNHLCYFKFVGRVIAKAIYDNKLLECYFTRSIYKHILSIHVKHTDMESEDYSFYQGLVYLMEHHVSDLGYDLTFSAEVQEFGVTDVRDLIPNGRNIPVTENNKMDYIRLVCQMKMTGAIRKQINAFLEGFYDIIPKRLISIFNEQELELLISGMPNVDIEDLKANTEYHKYQPNSLQIQWFWRALRGFDQADRAKFLQFVTGTSKVPLQGFAALEGMNGVQKFQIHRDDRSTDRLPSAHTCFNQLDLPVYETYDKLRTYLLKAIHECSEGFGFA